MTDDGAAALDALYWRDEILQAMYWMHGEGLADAADAAELARFLAADVSPLVRELDRLAAGGYLELVPGPDRRYRLTELGIVEGGRSFSDEFVGLTGQAHGECGLGCWCQDPEREGELCPSLEPVEEPA